MLEKRHKKAQNVDQFAEFRGSTDESYDEL